MDYAITIENGRAKIKTPYNPDFVAKIKSIGGKWDGTGKTWSVQEEAVDAAREIMRQVYGRDDINAGELCTVTVTVKKELSELRAPVTLFGKTLASASGRDSGARTGDDVFFLSGSPISDGSVKNWHTTIPAGCVIQLANVPKALLESSLPDGAVEISVSEQKTSREKLEDEKKKLLERIAEIDRILNA